MLTRDENGAAPESSERPAQVAERPSRCCGETALAARREEILDAATELFAAHGYSDAVTQALADKLQFGKGTLYRSFASKRELFLAAVDRVMVRARDCVEAATAGIDDPLEAIARGIETHLRFFFDHREYVELIIQERAYFKDRGQPTYFAHRDANVERWKPVYRALIEQGRVRDVSVERITDVISDLVYGTLFTNHFNGPRKPFEEQTRDILDVLFHGILSEGERSRRSAASPASRRAVRERKGSDGGAGGIAGKR
ncbi:MAG: TetR/AcrR family transcriptional regulator [Planctomycetota bacterium]|nr:TetR/AcrR family transcriptional regulator [Planctomycetota bacterium]